MSIQQAFTGVRDYYIFRTEICEYADSLVFISLGRDFRCGFSYFDEEGQRLWMSILGNRASRSYFFVMTIQRPIIQALIALEDHWTEEIDYELW